MYAIWCNLFTNLCTSYKIIFKLFSHGILVCKWTFYSLSSSIAGNPIFSLAYNHNRPISCEQGKSYQIWEAGNSNRLNAVTRPLFDLYENRTRHPFQLSAAQGVVLSMPEAESSPAAYYGVCYLYRENTFSFHFVLFFFLAKIACGLHKYFSFIFSLTKSLYLLWQLQS